MHTPKNEAHPVRRVIVDLVNSFRRDSGKEYMNAIPSPEEFSRILERERERSDRSGQTFSLVVFEYGENTDIGRILMDCILSRRVRAIDEVGWYKEGAIAALLPSTSPEGAWKFAKDVINGIPSEISAPNYRVYTYPSSCTSGGNGNGDGRIRKENDQGTIHPGESGTRIHPVSTQSRIESEYLGTVFGQPMPVWKRLLDILGALVALVVFSPLFLLIALFIKIVSRGPVFYCQERVGYLGRKFTFWKFRTMHVNNDATDHRQYLSTLIQGDAPMAKMDAGRDSRIIPFGRFLRSSCLDELPQLFNVLQGDMSLVGPRPCLPYEAEEYLQWHSRRFDVVPGMTGLWQVSGKNRLTFKEMIRLDIRYSRLMSPWVDAKILLLTGPAILGMISEPVAQLKSSRSAERSPFPIEKRAVNY